LLSQSTFFGMLRRLDLEIYYPYSISTRLEQ
jgi:hypothetical protein